VALHRDADLWVVPAVELAEEVAVAQDARVPWSLGLREPLAAVLLAQVAWLREQVLLAT